MKKKPEDRRVRYTKMVLKDSFIKLLEKKDISRITIKELCEDADINRATFYAHYSDQYDLMERIQDELLDNIADYLAAYTKNELPSVPVDTVEHIFEYIKENARLCKLLLSERGDLNFQKRVLMLAYEKNINDLIKNGVTSREDAEYIYAFTLTGCVGVIQKWLNDNMVKSPRYMAETITELTNVGVKNTTTRI
ncbi:MAG: TetR/AcrR family transcriptional regulator [Saccharofermentanales bacterium]|jgi:AcrR family transcriptional regulator|nr:TetR/AcrR family transcriptional regulator [Clostridiaceae bacterium]